MLVIFSKVRIFRRSELPISWEEVMWGAADTLRSEKFGQKFLQGATILPSLSSFWVFPSRLDPFIPGQELRDGGRRTSRQTGNNAGLLLCYEAAARRRSSLKWLRRERAMFPQRRNAAPVGGGDPVGSAAAALGSVSVPPRDIRAGVGLPDRHEAAVGVSTHGAGMNPHGRWKFVKVAFDESYRTGRGRKRLKLGLRGFEASTLKLKQLNIYLKQFN